MSDVLTPPNIHLLSQDVISAVVQRKRRYRDFSSGIRQEPKRNSQRPESKEIENLLKLSQTLKRERRRVNQARFRKKQNGHILTLERETEQLQQEIEKLTERKRVNTSSIQPKGSIWNIVAEYVRVFGNPSASPEEFLDSTMTLDVAFNSEQGVGPILRSWRCLSWWFKDLEVELEAVTKNSPDTLVASTRTSFTITEDTLSRVFPNLVNNSALASKLLDQEISIQGWTLFQWDDTGELVTRVNSESDLLSPMLRLLGSLESISVAFDQALITLDFQVRQGEVSEMQ